MDSGGPTRADLDLPPFPRDHLADARTSHFDGDGSRVLGRGTGSSTERRAGEIATMQDGPPRTAPPLGVAFDASLDGDIDQPLALAMLFVLEGRRQIRVPSISTSRFNLQAARFLDLVARFYGGEQGGDFVVNRLPLPIGMAATGAPTTDASPMLAAALTKTAADGKAVYPRPLTALNDTADPVALIRNA